MVVAARRIKLYADGADLVNMAELAKREDVRGFTTNPSLMKKAGISDYPAFAREVLGVIRGKPVSFEVFADDLPGMEHQARVIADWGDNVYVKIPITNTLGESTAPVVAALVGAGIKVNVTAILTREQARTAVDAIGTGIGIVSVFAGRIADTGRDPMRVMRSARARIRTTPGSRAELLWASTREVYNVVQAEESHCDIITLLPSMIAKMGDLGRSLTAYSLDTVKQFARDAAGLTL